MPDDQKELIGRMVDVCSRLYARGMVAATDGNISVRLPSGSFLTTRSSINKGMVTAEDIIEVDSSGQALTQGKKPSTELPMHLFIYNSRPDVNAVVHAHPTYATAFAAAGLALDKFVLPEVIVGLGPIPLAPYATPSTKEVPQSLAPFVKQSRAILLANHGVVTYGNDLLEAYFRMEKVEHAAHISFLARQLGGEKILSAHDIEKLKNLSGGAYGGAHGKVVLHDLIDESKNKTTSSAPSSSPVDEEARKAVRQMLHP